MSSPPQKKTLLLKRIRLDGGTQSRAVIDDDVVAEYAEVYADEQNDPPMPPVTVFWDKSDFWLADGFQRVSALKSLGRDRVEALVISGTLRDAILFSVGANVSHGLRRTNADKRKAVTTLLEDEEWGQWSNREIASECKVGEKLVRTLRKDLTAASRSMDEATDDSTLPSNDNPQSEERTYIHHKTGKPTKMKTTNIGHSKKPGKKTKPSKKTSIKTVECEPMELETIPLLKNDPRKSAQMLVDRVGSDYLDDFVDELNIIHKVTEEFQPVKCMGRYLKQTRLRLSHDPDFGALAIVNAIGKEYAKELSVSLINHINQE